MAEVSPQLSSLLGAGILAALGLYLIMRSRRRLLDSAESRKAREELKMQSVEVEGSEGARRFALTDKIITRFHDGVNTSYDAFMHGAKLSGDSPCLGVRAGQDGKYNWLTYNQVHERATHVGSGLIHLGCEPSQKTFIGILAPNCVEWNLAELGCVMNSMVTVPIYDTHGSEGCAFIINQVNLATVFCHGSKVPFLLEIAQKCKCLKRVIKIGAALTDDENDVAEKLGIETQTFQEVEELGKNNPSTRKLPRPEDIFTICYTSGTTGTPKGAIITHENLISNLSSYLYMTSVRGYNMSTSDVHISYLPLAHMYERMNHTIYFCSGARIGFYRGDPKLLLEDIQELK